ncbi:MAG: DUF2520 domain-containing protein [Bacteroidales bacterium]|jgi:predicted short-subunit dehydrogenase-like oxidoreductase (DUF2520 family)|nr:DUF2520 domain-containing protein [Bacteroidales bacterium]
MIRSITLLGAGNVATHFGRAFRAADIRIAQVYSRTQRSAESLAAVLCAPFTTDVTAIDRTSDLILAALSDDAVVPVLEQGQWDGCILAHTSGSLPMDVLRRFSPRCGVMYPLQTFSKQHPLRARDFPVCTEAATPELAQELRRLAATVSDVVVEVDSAARKRLHLAAVFACNFVNYCYCLADRVSEGRLAMLEPLIRETAAKIGDLPPLQAQTGPARRHDRQIIATHLEMLAANPDCRRVYSLLSAQIMKLFINQNKNTYDICKREIQ